MPRSSTKKRKPTPILSHDGKCIGVVKDGVFIKKARSSEHMLQVPPAWACDVVSMRAAVKAGATVMRIEDTDTGAAYWASINHLRRFSFVIERGSGKQVAMPLEHWMKRTKGAPEQLTVTWMDEAK